MIVNKSRSVLPWIVIGMCALAAQRATAWSPGTANRFNTGGFVVDPQNRTDVLSFYNAVYMASEGYRERLIWTGDLATCNAGTTDQNFRNDVLRRVNFYRALTGISANIVFNAEKTVKAQQAALMMSRNNSLSHNPPTSWSCYSANGYEAAGASNLALGNYGPGAVDAYIDDPGANNYLVGHRRWILSQSRSEMGTGDVPPSGGNPAANSLWVTGAAVAPSVQRWVAWPNEGYCPQPLATNRFSLSRPGANFAGATVSMQTNGSPVSVTMISRTDNGYGDNTIVWQPSALTPNATHSITVSGISGTGIPTSYSYTVNLFDPADLGSPLAVAGSPAPPPSGASYSLTRPNGIDALSAVVSRLSATAWTEGAENATSSRVIDGTASSYTLRQTTVKRSGDRAFHLTFPTFADGDQWFELDRNLFITTGDTLSFHQRFRFSTTGSRLRAEVSSNGGVSWTEVWGRNGNGSTSGAGWDSIWNPVSVDLSSFAGQVIRVRFRYTVTGSAFLGTSTNDGVFVDDITVANSEELVSPVTTSLSPQQTTFELNPTTAGGALVTGTSYLLSLRANVGSVWYASPTPLLVTVGNHPANFHEWISALHPDVTGGPEGDHDHDGIRNLVEYAFGLDLKSPTPSSALPQPQSLPAEYRIQFTRPAQANGVTYHVDWSNNLRDWNPVPNHGSGNQLDFRLAKNPSHTKIFFRHRVFTPSP